MAEPKHIAVEDAHEEGVYGTIHDPLDNEAYTLQGQGEDTAKREREVRAELRERWFNADKESEASKPAKSKSKSSSGSSPSGSSSSGSSGS